MTCGSLLNVSNDVLSVQQHVPPGLLPYRSEESNTDKSAKGTTSHKNENGCVSETHVRSIFCRHKKKILACASAFLPPSLFQITQMDIDYGGLSNTAWGNATDPQGYRLAASDLHVLALPRRHEIQLSEFHPGAGKEAAVRKAADLDYLDYLALFLPCSWHPPKTWQ